jgi:hypothetical protein
VAVSDDDSSVTDTASAAEHEAVNELVQGELAGKVVYVPPVKKWRASGLSALRDGDFDKWAESTLLDDDFDTWMEVDPTLEQIEGFFESVNPGLGTSPGNSRRSKTSSRSTRKR